MDFNKPIFYPFIITIFGLGFYLFYLIYRMWKQKKYNETLWENLNKFNDKNRTNAIESMRIIALAVQQDQCTLTEGCIRLKKLLEHTPEIKKMPELNVIHLMYAEVRNFATHDKYKGLSLNDRYKQDKTRVAVEHRYETELKDACRELRKTLKKISIENHSNV